MNSISTAIHYIELGYPLLPIQPGSKRPIGYLAPRGVHSASTSPLVVKSWLLAEPHANVALVPPPGAVVLDFDLKSDFELFLQRWPALARAPHSRTPRGGAHVYLQVPPEAHLRARSPRGLPAFEVKRSLRNYLLECPSCTEQGEYRWQVPLRPPHELPPVPPDLLSKLRVHQSVFTPAPSNLSEATLQALLRRSTARVRVARPGTRHLTLLRESVFIGALILQGLNEQTARQALLRAALEAGLPRYEAVSAIQWGLATGQQNPSPIQELSPRLRLWLARRGRASEVRNDT